MPRRQPVYFVLPPNTLLLDLAGPADALRYANLCQDDVAFEIHYVGPERRVMSSIGLSFDGIGPLPDALPHDAIVILVGSADVPYGTDPHQDRASSQGAHDAIVDFLRTCILPHHRLVCICSGAMLAGRAGLLDGRNCTTHHTDCAKLRIVAPKANVLDNRIYVTDGLVSSSAGVTSGIDLMLHLLAEMLGPRCAVAIARYLVVYLRRTGGDPQLSPWLTGRNHIHPAVHRTQDAIVADPARAWTLEELGAISHTSPRHLTRLFRDHTGTNVIDYVHRLRIALARELLNNSELDLERIAEHSGFGSSRQLRRVWHKYETSPPSHLRRSPGAATGTR